METGCYIDGSHWSSFDFTTAVIDFAVERGFEIDMETYRADLKWIKSEEWDEDKYLDIVSALDWTYEDALSYLNDNVRDGYCWSVEDQSLFLEEVND